MIILGIESSCDETAVALIRDGEVLCSLVSSQIEVHRPFGGVVPEVAAREHLNIIAPLFHQACETAGITPEGIDLIAVTQGPGLMGALLVGLSFAKGLAVALNKPLIPVDHVHAHIHGAVFEVPNFANLFPALSLVVSGGHSNLYFMENPTSFKLIAATIDDACGECFDKVAKLYGFGYPGGPVVERIARTGNPKAYEMPKMMPENKRMAFSYSGLKTHMLYLRKKLEGGLTDAVLADVFAAFQEEALNQIMRKLKQAMHLYPAAKHIIVGGGVAMNGRLRAKAAKELALPAIFAPRAYCIDNAAMIAALGWQRYQSTIDKTVFSDHNWDAYARYDFTVGV